MTAGVCGRCGFDPSQWTSTHDVERTLAHVDRLVALAVEGLDPQRWRSCVDADGATIADHVDAVRRHYVEFDGEEVTSLAPHELFHGLAAIGRLRSCVDDPGPMVGELAGVYASDGGVPKRPVAVAVIDERGVVGDVQSDRKHHGRPWQALCLFSADVVGALRAEGHPVEPGCTGENLSIAGVDWAQVRAGLVIDIGDVRCRISAPAEPCRKNDRWFRDRSSTHIDHELHPGWSRWYASVLRGGTVRPGDRVVVGARER